MFALHPQLAKDTHVVGEFELSLLLLMNDSQYPWCILVPRREGLREIYELDAAAQVQFINESSVLTASMQKIFSADKMNIAALGNVVPQLHIHHIARFTNDPAWPAPVWGKVSAKPYSASHVAERIAELQNALHDQCGFSPSTQLA